MSIVNPITYSNKGPLLTRLFVTSLEYMTGRLTMEKMYKDVNKAYKAHPDRPFFNHALDAMGVDIHYEKGSVNNIPTQGSLIVVANHPFGILDGLIINHILHKVRQDYKILTNEVLTKAQPMEPWSIAIDDSDSAEGTRKNNNAIREMMRLLRSHHCIGIFPAGRLARPKKWGKPCEDWDWKPLVGHLAKKCKPKNDEPLMILPIFFEGENSTMFKLAALAKLFTVTRSLVIYEFINKRKSKISVRIGQAFNASDIKHKTAEEATTTLREKTIKLGQS